MFDDISIIERINTMGIVSRSIQEPRGASRSFQECPGASRNRQECQGMSKSMDQCPGASRNRQECQGMSKSMDLPAMKRIIDDPVCLSVAISDLDFAVAFAITFIAHFLLAIPHPPTDAPARCSRRKKSKRPPRYFAVAFAVTFIIFLEHHHVEPLEVVTANVGTDGNVIVVSEMIVGAAQCICFKGKFAIVAADVLQKMMPNDGEANFGTFCAVVVQNMSRATIARIMPLISTLSLRSTSNYR